MAGILDLVDNITEILRLILFPMSETQTLAMFTPTMARQGHIKIGNKEHDIILAQTTAITGRYDHVWTACFMDGQRNGDTGLLADWPTVDSFVSAYGVRQFMRNMPQVNRVALGHLNLSASIDTTSKNIDHIAVWVTFSDGRLKRMDTNAITPWYLWPFKIDKPNQFIKEFSE